MHGTGDHSAVKDGALCRFCGNKLGLLQRLAKSEFCSTAHRTEYLREQEELALACLQEALAISEAPAPELKFEAETQVEPEISRPAAFVGREAAAPASASSKRDQEAGPREAGFVGQGCSLGPFYPALESESCEPVFEELSRPRHALSGPPALAPEYALGEAGLVYDPVARAGGSVPVETAVTAEWLPAVAALPRFEGSTVFDAEAALASAQQDDEPADPPQAECQPGVPAMPPWRPMEARVAGGEPVVEPRMAPEWTALSQRQSLRSSGPPAPRRQVKAVLDLQETAAAPLLDPIPFEFGSQGDAWQPEF
jgi:hypothetical protein